MPCVCVTKLFNAFRFSLWSKIHRKIHKSSRAVESRKWTKILIKREHFLIHSKMLHPAHFICMRRKQSRKLSRMSEKRVLKSNLFKFQQRRWRWSETTKWEKLWQIVKMNYGVLGRCEDIEWETIYLCRTLQFVVYKIYKHACVCVA